MTPEEETRIAAYERGYLHGHRDIWIPVVAIGISCGVLGYIVGLPL